MAEVQLPPVVEAFVLEPSQPKLGLYLHVQRFQGHWLGIEPDRDAEDLVGWDVNRELPGLKAQVANPKALLTSRNAVEAEPSPGVGHRPAAGSYQEHIYVPNGRPAIGLQDAACDRALPVDRLLRAGSTGR